MANKKNKETVVDDEKDLKKEKSVSEEETAKTDAEYTEAELSEMESLRQEAEEAKNFALRTKADLENMKKRNQNIATEMYAEGKIETVMKILPILDSFDRAMAVEIPAEIKSGFEKIQKQFIDALSKLGIEEIASINEVFDPKFHNALMQVENEEMSGKIVQVYEKGYTLGDKVIRHAGVVVAK